MKPHEIEVLIEKMPECSPLWPDNLREQWFSLMEKIRLEMRQYDLRTMHVMILPMNEHEFMQLEIPLPLTEQEWGNMMQVLTNLKSGWVKNREEITHD